MLVREAKTARIALQPAYVLHTRTYGDSSLLLEVLSGEYGRLGLLARGARGGRRSRQGLLQPFLPLLLSWSGRGELPVLTGVDCHGVALIPRGEALLCGLYLNELLVRLTHRGDSHPALFAYYAQALAELAEALPVEPVLRRFELQLLTEVGFGLVLDREAQGEAGIRPDRVYTYFPGRGALPGRIEGAMGVEIPGRSLLALDGGDHAGTLWDEPVLRDAKRLLRTVLHYHLGGRPLVSRELFRGL